VIDPGSWVPFETRLHAGQRTEEDARRQARELVKPFR
jgi:hypothetical protein